MTKEQNKHLKQIQDFFVKKVAEKYKKGAKEHGGNLWEVENLLDEAIAEVLDLATYLITLKLR